MTSRFPLAILPTPLHRLERASEALGLDLWIKRDDLTGFALGGNKARKLEYLISEALVAGAEVVVSCGSTQSNFLRQLGSACAMAGLQCVAVVMDLPFEDAEPREAGLMACGGNDLLNQLAGVQVRKFANGTWEELFAHAEAISLSLEQSGKRVFRVPVGGSTPEGVLAFFEASKEIEQSFDRVVFASSSGSTQVGLALGLQSLPTQVYGVACDPEPGLVEDFAELCRAATEKYNLGPKLGAEQFDLDLDFVGAGYGIPSTDGMSAIQWLVRKEGIYLDPIYSAKAFAALLSHSQDWRGEKVLFWHTGGTPTLFALAQSHIDSLQSR